MNSTRRAISICTVAFALGACGGSQPPIGAPGAMPQASALATRISSANYKLLYSFGAVPDGHNPEGSLIDVGGTLYGATAGGGSYKGSGHCTNYGGCGTVFSITPSGTEQVLHSFGNGGDGVAPAAGLVDVGGTFYGTTSAGGSSFCNYYTTFDYCGTVFSMTPDGTEHVLHSFVGAPGDGAVPNAALIEVKGKLYGTTIAGGVYYSTYDPELCCGTVFSITTSGTESVLHSFGAGRDGAVPEASLVDVRGKLYGTTNRDDGGNGAGAVFSITPSGKEKVLHRFGKGTDGSEPAASLIDVKGALYGTTEYGGAYHGGTVFSITTSGTERVLHSFGAGGDGIHPVAPLIEVKGKLYGTTWDGGLHGDGTVFSITTGGTERVLHSFGGCCSDGDQPFAGLTDVNGTLYGTTFYGGTHGSSYGTVFALTP